MKLKIMLSSMVILVALFLSAFGSPATPQTVHLQETVVPPAITMVAPTLAEGTPGVIPVTGGDAPTGMWTLVLFGLLGLLGIAFLVALFSPRHTHEYIDRNPPPPEI